MAIVNIDGVDIDTEDIAWLVAMKTVSELYAYVETDRRLIEQFRDDPDARAYLEHRLSVHQDAFYEAKRYYDKGYEPAKPITHSEKIRGLEDRIKQLEKGRPKSKKNKEPF